MDVQRERAYWPHEEARWIVYMQVGDEVVADEPAPEAREVVDPRGETVRSADRKADGPDTERATTLTP